MLNFSNDLFEENQELAPQGGVVAITYPTQADSMKSKAKNKGVVIGEPIVSCRIT